MKTFSLDFKQTLKISAILWLLIDLLCGFSHFLTASNPLDGTWINTKETKNFHKIIISNNAMTIEVWKNCQEPNCSWRQKPLRTENNQIYTANYSNRRAKRLLSLKLVNGELLVKYDVHREGKTARQRQFRFKREILMTEMEKNTESKGNKTDNNNNAQKPPSSIVVQPTQVGTESMKTTENPYFNGYSIDTGGGGGSTQTEGTIDSGYSIGGTPTIEGGVGIEDNHPNVIAIDPNALDLGSAEKVPTKEKIPMQKIRIDPRSLRVWMNYLSEPAVFKDESRSGPVGTLKKVEITPPRSIEVPRFGGVQMFITIVAEELGSTPPVYHTLYFLNDSDNKTIRKALKIYHKLQNALVDEINGFPKIIESQANNEPRRNRSSWIHDKYKLLPTFELFYLSAKGKLIPVNDLHTPAECISFDPYNIDKRTSGSKTEFGFNLGNYFFNGGYSSNNGYSKWAIFWFDTEQARDNAIRVIQQEGFNKACYCQEDFQDNSYPTPDFKLMK